MSAITPVNRTPSVGTDERSSAQPLVSLGDRMAEAGGPPPKKKKLPVPETALLAVAVPAVETQELPRALSVGTGAPVTERQGFSLPAEAGRTAAQHPVLADREAPATPATVTQAGDRRVVPVSDGGPPPARQGQRDAAAMRPPGSMPVPPPVSVAAPQPASPAAGDGVSPVLSSTLAPVNVGKESGERSDLAVSLLPLGPESASLTRAPQSLPMATSLPQGLAVPVRVPNPPPVPVAPAAAPAPSMTVAFQSWGLGHQVHAQWIPAGVVLTPSSDRVGNALASATLEGAAAVEGDRWRVEAVDDQRDQRQRSRHEAEHDAQ